MFLQAALPKIIILLGIVNGIINHIIPISPSPAIINVIKLKSLRQKNSFLLTSKISRKL